MSNDGDLAPPNPTAENSVDTLFAYRTTFGRHLAGLREGRGYSEDDAAKLIGIAPETLRQYEKAERRPSMLRLLRLARIYDTPPLVILEDVARAVRPPPDPTRAYTVEALLFFTGVTPEQVAPDRFPSTGRSDPPEGTPSPGPADEPLGEAVKYLRNDDPLRVRGGLLLRKEYEDGATIRELGLRHKLSFGTIRTLLVEAGTRFRARGNPRPGGT
ncbi:hypothetical protein GCM10022243_61930 [Saccharothrix violaceirubra]|uniref:Transcriptional regulator with XRE-family HTH domain n=1 Tax=Saccharothrix violaceirubra TaxID=413306 RepID=A0A7W7T7T4_9PSEU|nr:helix-turn-helix domain-containing protein [Saccharothrix violaceirubra]MBB4968169.1 transcriptional regulator with XRE-family HTH domain [Saccharothrix violaceirubra]